MYVSKYVALIRNIFINFLSELQSHLQYLSGQQHSQADDIQAQIFISEVLMQRFNTTQLRIQKLNTNNVSLVA